MTKFTLLLIFLVIIALVLGGIGLGVSYLETKTVQGTVTDATGAPIDRAAVTIAGRSTFSNAQGFYEIQFPRGAWELRAFADGFQETAQQLDADAWLKQNFSAAVTMQPRAWRARVVANETQLPLANARVEVDGQVLETNAQGEFVAHGIKNGAKIKISKPGYRHVTVTVQAAGDPKQITNIALAPSELRVLVLDASNQKPLPGVRVQANGTNGNTDVNGAIVLKGLAEGVEISAQAPGYAQANAKLGNQAELQLELQPTSLTGRIVDSASQQPIANASVLTSRNTNFRADARGTFKLEDFSQTPKLYVKKPGYLLGAFDLTKGGAQDFALTPFHAKGIHLYYGIKKADAERVLNQFQGTEMNAVVFDVKEDPGYILWDSQAPLAQEIGAYVPREYNAQAQVQTCREFKLYCIARVTVFKDVLLAKARPDLALHNSAGGLLYENAAYWTNPAETEVQDYHIALAKELAEMGFDEIQYDYIRFPGTRDVLVSEFGDADYRVSQIKNFLARTSEALRPTTAFFSGDVFGLTTATADEQGIGQVWEEIAHEFDFISPMMYPSTWRYATNLWGAGFGIKNCGDSYACPYDIMRYGTVKAQERTTNDWTLVRPWLQAYQMNLYDMLQQAQGSDDANSSGYLFWNNLAVYPNGLFK